MSNILIKRKVYDKSRYISGSIFYTSIVILFFGIVIVLAIVYFYSILIVVNIIVKILVFIGFTFGLICIVLSLMFIVAIAIEDLKNYYIDVLTSTKFFDKFELSNYLNIRSLFINNFIINNFNLIITEQHLSDLFYGLKNNYESIQIIKYNLTRTLYDWENFDRRVINNFYDDIRANNPKLKKTTFYEFILIKFDRKLKGLFELRHRDWLDFDDYISNLDTLQKLNYLADEYSYHNDELMLKNDSSKNKNSLNVNLLKNEENAINFYPFYGLSNLSSLSNLTQLVLKKSIFSELFFNTLIANIREMNLKYFKFYDNVTMEFCCQNTTSIKKMFEVILRKVDNVDIELFFNNSNIKYSNLTYKVNDFPYKLDIKIAGKIRNQYFKNRDKLIYKNII